MAINEIPVDQRVIDIDSRRFASIEKALVELITNSDDSYARLEKAGRSTTGEISVQYERHQKGALLVVTDKAEGMSFEQVRRILTYGGAHSPLARGESGGRGYFGRGLKQAIYGLGHGWIETIQNGRISRIELFRSENGGYIYDDWSGDRPALSSDYSRLGIDENGTQVTIVVENAHVNISRYGSLVQSVSNNIYLRDVLERRKVELVNLQRGRELEKSGQVRYEEPPSMLLLGPDETGHFEYQNALYPFTLTLKRALDTELTPSGDERTNGLVVISDMAVLDCQLFDYENQVGTEYLFGTVRCPALIEKLGQGMAIISDEREGLNHKDPFVHAFSRAVSTMISSSVLAEQEKLKHLERASTSERTNHMIEHLLERMNLAAARDLGIMLPADASEPVSAGGGEVSDLLRFTTPFYYRKLDHPFHVALLIDPAQFPEDEVLQFEYTLPESMRIEPIPAEIPIRELGDTHRIEWTVTGRTAGENGRIMVRAGSYWAWCEIVVAEHTSHHSHSTSAHAAKRRVPRDHGADMFAGYELRNLENELNRAVYSPEERKIIINTGAPTVQLYVDGRGHFRDSARLLLAELFMDVISDELAHRLIERTGQKGDMEAYHAAKMDIIRRYGSDIHLSFLKT
ncbi:MAG TPA: ATP-binding protein [Sulfurovum sp.]|uniref:ATP-binding protein n=1 Tax=Sulfurovum sp. TaxID=1969726 RepID=UPI002F9347EC